MSRRTLHSALAVIFLGVVAGSSFAEEPVTARPRLPHDGADTAWMLVSTALVMLMIPGLALFYGGMARRKNILATVMQSMVALGVVGVTWVVLGYALAFGHSQGGWIGWSPELVGLAGVDPGHSFTTINKIPLYLHCMYQGMFAIITPALIAGALAERIRFGPYCLFILLWSLLVYAPLAHWVWAVDLEGNAVGWLGKMGALDFAGGTVVHIAAGVSALAAILLLRKRAGYLEHPEHPAHPSSAVLSLLGAGLLWFGWFGFNGGSGLGSGGLAALALTTTQAAAAAAALTWTLLEWRHRGKPTGMGFATGLVAGLVGVTPAAGFVSPLAALVIGSVTAGCCYAAVSLKPRLKYDDSLDAFGVHGVGGIVGALLTGVFASSLMFKSATGNELPGITLLGGAAPRVLVQLVAVVAASAFAFVLTAVLVKAIDAGCGGFCVDPQTERKGLDRSLHGEMGFDLTPHPAPDAHAHEPRSTERRVAVTAEEPSNGERVAV